MSWPQVPLGEISVIVTGKTPSTKDEANFGGDVPFVTPAELDADTTIISTPRTLTEVGAASIKLVPKNAVLVGCIGTLGKVGMAGKSLATNQQINGVVFDEAKVWPRFGYYAAKRLRPEMEMMAPATTVKIISKSKFSELKIPLPPLSEQKRIAGILDQADALVRLRRRALEKLNTLGQAIFHEMFGDPIANELGFPTTEVGDVIAGFETGKNIAEDPDDQQIEGYRVLKISAVTSGVFKPQESKPLPVNYEPPASHIVTNGDLLFSRANTAQLIGATAFVRTQSKNLVLPDKLWRFIWKPESEVLPVYVKALFSLA